MKIQTLSMKSIITNRDSIHNYFGWPTVSRLKNGSLAAVASGFRLWHICPFGKDVISFSEDEGETWSIPSITVDTPFDDRDSGVVPFGENGVMITSFNSDICDVSFLSKHPETESVGEYTNAYYAMLREHPALFEKYRGSLFRISHDNGRTFGELKKAPVSNPHGPIALPDGSFLWIGNELKNTAFQPLLACYHVCEDGRYERLGEIEQIEGLQMWEPHAIRLPSGKIIVHIRMESAQGRSVFYSTFQCESCDGGHTFTKPHTIGSDKIGGAPAHIIADGNTLISVYSRRAEPHAICAAFSYDGGETWDCDHVIAALPDREEDFGYPSSVVLKNGDILTVFYGADEGTDQKSFYVAEGSSVYQYTTPVIREVIWRYSED